MNDWRKDDQTLCFCHNVTAGRVREVVRATAPRDPRDIGVACRAGTGCRSCLPDIEVIMRQERDARRARGPLRFLWRLFSRKGRDR